MAATLIGAANDPTSSDSRVSSRVVTKPVGAQVAVFFVNFWIGDGDTTITPPAGAVLRNNTVLGDARTATYLRYVDGDATGTTYTFTFTPGPTWSALKAAFFADVDAALDLATAPFNTATAGGTAYADTSVTTVTGAALAWSGNAAEYSSPPTHTPPTSFTEVGDTDMSASAYRISPGDGSQSATGAATSVSVNNKISALVALAPAAGGAAPSGSFDVEDVVTVGFVGTRASSASFAVPDVATVQWTAARESAAAFAVDDVATVTWVGSAPSIGATFEVSDVATVEWTGARDPAAVFAVADVVTVAWAGPDDGEPVGMIVGTVTGPSRKVETVTGPAMRRVVTGPAVSRKVTGPSLAAFSVDGPSRHVATLDGPNLSRLITGPDVARTLTGPGK